MQRKLQFGTVPIRSFFPGPVYTEIGCVNCTRTNWSLRKIGVWYENGKISLFGWKSNIQAYHAYDIVILLICHYSRNMSAYVRTKLLRGNKEVNRCQNKQFV